MNNRIAKFEKVSYEQFCKDLTDEFGGYTADEIREIYDNIKLPQRGTSGSAGYDFYSPFPFELTPNDNIKIPTGIKAYIKDGWVLMEYVRSSIGFKYGVTLSNGTGIIDSDYHNNDGNEGHIFIKLSNNNSAFNKTLFIEQGESFAQGIFLPYGITFDDDAIEIRVGGIGSTN